LIVEFHDLKELIDGKFVVNDMPNKIRESVMKQIIWEVEQFESGVISAHDFASNFNWRIRRNRDNQIIMITKTVDDCEFCFRFQTERQQPHSIKLSKKNNKTADPIYFKDLQDLISQGIVKRDHTFRRDHLQKLVDESNQFIGNIESLYFDMQTAGRIGWDMKFNKYDEGGLTYFSYTEFCAHGNRYIIQRRFDKKLDYQFNIFLRDVILVVGFDQVDDLIDGGWLIL